MIVAVSYPDTIFKIMPAIAVSSSVLLKYPGLKSSLSYIYVKSQTTNHPKTDVIEEPQKLLMFSMKHMNKKTPTYIKQSRVAFARG